MINECINEVHTPKMVLEAKSQMPVDIMSKYPTDGDLEYDLTEEEVQDIADNCLKYNVEEMKKV